MKTKFVLSLILSALVGMCPLAALADDSTLAAADNGFGFKLLKQLVKEQPTQNIFILPYSAATVLQMVGNGAAGPTKAEMQQVLGIGNLPDAEVNVANKDVAQTLNDPNTNIILNTADAIWYRSGVSVNPDFLTVNHEFFDATVEPLDFGDPAAVDVINSWASEKTHGRITHFADGMIDPVQTQLFLANTVYFKGNWAYPFNVNDTKDRPFYLRDGSQKTIPMMEGEAFTYWRGPGYQAVGLFYDKEDYRDKRNLALYVFLPDTNSSPEQLLKIMSGDEWQRVTKPSASGEEGMLVLPKFKFDYSAQLKEPLRALGMKTAFDPGRADFSRITQQQPLYIYDALQKTFIEVNEEGTEAAAASAIDVAGGGAPSQNPFSMIVNRPFIFLIEDNQTGVILFMGAIFDPSAN